MVVILEGVAMVIDKETESVVLKILTQNEELLRELKKEQQQQAVSLHKQIIITQGLMDDVDKLKGEL